MLIETTVHARCTDVKGSCYRLPKTVENTTKF